MKELTHLTRSRCDGCSCPDQSSCQEVCEARVLLLWGPLLKYLGLCHSDVPESCLHSQLLMFSSKSMASNLHVSRKLFPYIQGKAEGQAQGHTVGQECATRPFKSRVLYRVQGARHSQRHAIMWVAAHACTRSSTPPTQYTHSLVVISLPPGMPCIWVGRG